MIVPDNQLSLAIGKKGQNARLAAKLTGMRIDIKSEAEVETERADAEESRGGARERCRARPPRSPQALEEAGLGSPRAIVESGREALAALPAVGDRADKIYAAARRWVAAHARAPSLSAEPEPAAEPDGGSPGGGRRTPAGGRVKHVPLRTCLGCRQRRAKRELVRLVRRADGVVVRDAERCGRGSRRLRVRRARPAWSALLKGGRLSHALRGGVPPGRGARARGAAREVDDAVDGCRGSQEVRGTVAATKIKVIELAKELGVTSKDLMVAAEEMGHKGVRAMTPLDQTLANELRVKLGKGRELPEETVEGQARCQAEDGSRSIGADGQAVIAKKPLRGQEDRRRDGRGDRPTSGRRRHDRQAQARRARPPEPPIVAKPAAEIAPEPPRIAPVAPAPRRRRPRRRRSR